MDEWMKMDENKMSFICNGYELKPKAAEALQCVEVMVEQEMYIAPYLVHKPQTVTSSFKSDLGPQIHAGNTQIFTDRITENN